MKDPVARFRRKGRLIAEVRFTVIPQMLDNRGHTIAAIHGELEDTFQFWKSNPNRTLFLDRQDNPGAEFVVSPTRLAVILEDGCQIPEFLDRAGRYLRCAYPLLENWLEEAERVGVRFLEVLEPPGQPSFQQIHTELLERFHKLPDESIEPTDSFAKMVYENGFYQVGPVREGEAWIKQHFKNPDVSVPPTGIGLDIDSKQHGVAISDADSLVDAVSRVCALSKAIEEAIVGHLGYLDE